MAPTPGNSGGPFGDREIYEQYAVKCPDTPLFPSHWVDVNDPIVESPLVSQLRTHCAAELIHPTEFPLPDAPYDTGFRVQLDGCGTESLVFLGNA